LVAKLPTRVVEPVIVMRNLQIQKGTKEMEENRGKWR